MVVGVLNGRFGAYSNGKVYGIFEGSLHEVVALQGSHIGIDHHQEVISPISGDASVPVNAFDIGLERFVVKKYLDVFVAKFFLGEGGDFGNIFEGGDSSEDFRGELLHNILPSLFHFRGDIIAEVGFFNRLFELECAAFGGVGTGIAGNRDGTGECEDMIENRRVYSDNGVKLFSPTPQAIEVFCFLGIGGEVGGEIGITKHPALQLHIPSEWPGGCHLDIGILDALVEEIGVFNEMRNELTILDFYDRVLSQETSARAEFEIVLKEDEEDASAIVFCGEFLDEGVDDLDLFLGVRLEREESGDFFKDGDGVSSNFGCVGLPVEENKKSPSEYRDRRTDHEESFPCEP